MASSSPRLIFIFSTFLVLVSTSDAIEPEKVGGGPVGARTPVLNVSANKYVQDLGRFAVVEQNKWARLNDAGAPLLSFVRVIKAESQVVAGVKYYLKLAASKRGGRVASFDAEVVVQPWAKAKTLVLFTPVNSGSDGGNL